MDKICIFFKNILNCIEILELSFIQRSNKVKLNFNNTLYGSLQNLKLPSLQTVVNSLDIDNITTVSKNGLVKKRNNNITFQNIRDLNNKIITNIYDPINNYFNHPKFKLDTDKKSFIKADNKNYDKNLFINTSGKRFIGVDCMIVNVNKKLINNDDIKSSKSGHYGSALISNMTDIVNRIPINYQVTHSSEKNFSKKKVNKTYGFLVKRLVR